MAEQAKRVVTDAKELARLIAESMNKVDFPVNVGIDALIGLVCGCCQVLEATGGWNSERLRNYVHNSFEGRMAMLDRERERRKAMN